MPLFHEPACPFAAVKGIIPEKAFPKGSLPTPTLPKATLLSYLLLPTVKLMMEIPSCTS
ncbi:TPA: hypothetical protein HA361_06260 [Candidatus Woesearchaeota archaeon]|nr:hypothetical protein [Candidatus Woesearchaeota archaeon]HII68630.1 hypothetical protein [Candidatus Woesearchaeota archaeon]